jgi:hypothetical protein
MLLGWRDEWVAAGWNGSAADTDSQRIQDMAVVEALARDRLGKGVADRLRAVIQSLGTSDPGIEEVKLVDAIEQLPPVWQEVFNKLPFMPATVDAWDGVTAEVNSDLAALQHALLTNKSASFMGDGSFFVLEADSEHTLSLGLVGASTGSDPCFVIRGRAGPQARFRPGPGKW